MLNAAPGLNASVSRTMSPTIRFGICTSRCLTASTLVATSRQMIAAAVVQNTRPFLFGELMSRGSGKLAGFARDGRRRRQGCVLRGGVFAPQDPGKKESPEAHRHVGDVERRPPRIAKADVDEIDHAERRSDAVDQ